MIRTPEAKTVTRQPKVCSDQATIGTAMPPSAKPSVMLESSAGALALEPVDQGDREREVTAQTRAQGHDDEGRIERRQRIDPAEQHESRAEE